ncbi:hypothetical protein CK203_116297 [Vitis vinifera]|uniref:Uncharacterized protein n=1 Tax=Vitis vinifera TaxID=29760 RepID=A0A438C9L4_VITVI|nr:hypothetical protein CK203_116297 [Vitis vinifera]
MSELTARMIEALSKALTSIQPPTQQLHQLASSWRHELRSLVTNRRDVCRARINSTTSTATSSTINNRPFLPLSHFPQWNRHMPMFVEKLCVGGDDTNDGEEAAGAVLASRSLKQGPFTAANSLSLNGKFNLVSKSKGPSNDMKCFHCGNSKHTRDTCFKLHGYQIGGMNYKLRGDGMGMGMMVEQAKMQLMARQGRDSLC